MRARRIDSNQNLIVKQLRIMGVSVYVSSMLGKGFPDLVLGIRGVNYLIELKDGSKVKSAKKLTKDEQVFFDTWKGGVYKCENLDEILNVIGFK